uniref:Uncharacterized protein n=1 Tax=Musa acuminata subsp. malaccensis TaxID=214687 RepID=A0A804KV27_MUSAM|nr:PREDICTED: uncharacterized protein LOC104000788 [Musa acuminata subsp. malaccensis]
MASSSPVNRPAHPLPAALPPVGASKAQAALAKIIAIISTVPPRLPEADALRHGGDPEAAGRTTTPAGQLGFGVDLKLRLGLATEIRGGSAEGDGPTEQSGVVDAPASAEPCRNVRAVEEVAPVGVSGAAAERSLSPAVSVAGGGDALASEKSSEGECDPQEENGGESRNEAAEDDAEEKASAEQKETDGSGGAEAGTTTTTAIATSSSSSRGRRSDGCLDLLLEAVRQVSGGLFDDDGPEAEKVEATAASEEAPAPSEMTAKRSAVGDGGGKKRRETDEWWIPLDLYEEETAPIVRSKRGRSQALPSRYRDSILDPWRKPPALSRNSTGRRGHERAPAATR